MSVINTNITALIGQQNLNRSASALQTAMERLSSGLRINSAKDDAAGQAIANRMSSQISGLQQAQRNANDGISMSQTAEGALNKINDNLQRIRELTVQAENGTNSESDLESIQSEITQRLEEINRVSEETSFNGTKVLDETRGLKIQVGAYDGESITINLKQINQSTLGLTGFNVDGSGVTEHAAATAASLATAGNIEATGGRYFLTTANTEASATDVLGKINAGNTLTVTGATTTELATALGAPTGSEVTLNGLTSDGADGFTYTATTPRDSDIAAYITPPAGEFTQATYKAGGIDHEIQIDNTGNITDLDGNQLFITAAGELTYDNVNGALNEATAGRLATAMESMGSNEATLTLANGAIVQSDSLDVEGISISAEALANVLASNPTITVTTPITVGSNAVSIKGIEVRAGGAPVYINAEGDLTADDKERLELFVRDNGNVTDVAANQYFVGSDGNITASATTPGSRTENPLDALDNALKAVDSLRSDLGALQNRFESAIDNLSTTATNLSAARSRIEDADYAVEVGNMTRAQILQQAGTSVLAQANQVPQTVLSLLR